jgi:hypothetical protein
MPINGWTMSDKPAARTDRWQRQKITSAMADDQPLLTIRSTLLTRTGPRRCAHQHRDAARLQRPDRSAEIEAIVTFDQVPQIIS